MSGGRPVQRGGRRDSGDLRGKVTYLPDIHRLLPQSPDAEQGVLSSFLLSPKEVGGLCVEMGIDQYYFHTPAHAQIFQCLMDRWESARPIDFISLTQHLRDQNQLDQVGGAAFVTELFTFIPTAANAAYYIEILGEKHALRKIITTCTEYAARSYDEQDCVSMLLDEVERDILAIRRVKTSERHTTKEDVMRAIEDIERIYDNRGSITGLETGLADIDGATDGLHDEEMFVIAASPSMGKSALALNIAEHQAVDRRNAVGIISLEMSRNQLMRRLLCSRARVNIQRIRDGYLSEKDFPALTQAASKIAESRIIIDDAAGTSIQRIRAVGRRWKHDFDIKLMVIDYLQLVTSNTKRAQDNRQIEVAEVSKGIKELARELKIPIIALAQITRDPIKQKRKPRLSDLRESGSIEQDADVVAFIHREEMIADDDETKQATEGQADLIIAKQRDGPTDTIRLTFLKEFTRFEDRARGPQEDPQKQLPIS